MISENSTFLLTIFKALCACMELDPDSNNASALIRQAYQEPENGRQLPRSTNVIYYYVTSDDDPVTGYQTIQSSDQRPSSSVPSVSSFLAYKLNVICYGPKAEENAHKIRSFLYIDGKGLPRQILRDAGIYPVPNPNQPSLTHEEEGSLWRSRADLEIMLRSTDALARTSRRGNIESAPVIIIKR